MPVLASTFYIAKNYRRFRWDVSGSSSTWTDSSYRYVKWTSGSGALSVLELPMDGVAEIGYQIVGGGAHGTGGVSVYYGPSHSFRGGAGGGAGQYKTGTANLNAVGSMSVSVGRASDFAFVAYRSSYNFVSGASYSGGYLLGGTRRSGESTSLGSLGAFGGVAAAGGAEGGTPGGAYFNNTAYHWGYSGGTSGNGNLGQSWPTEEWGYTQENGPAGGGQNVTLWDGSAAAVGGPGGLGGADSSPVANLSTPAGFGNGGAGSRNGDGAGNAYMDDGPISNSPATLGTDGVVIVRWPLVFEAAS